MATHRSNLSNNLPNHLLDKAHHDALDLTGLDHIFKWASGVVTDGGEDKRVKQARERRIRRQVLSLIQKAQEQKAVANATQEIVYLQRRTIALLNKVQEVNEENATLKQTMLAQHYALQNLPVLEKELQELRGSEIEKEAAITERRYLMDGLAKLKVERDYLDELLTSTEADNARIASMLRETRWQLAELKSRRWWHCFIPKQFRMYA